MAKKKEHSIKIHLCEDWYIGSNSLEFHIYKEAQKNDETSFKDHVGHYSTINSLLDSLPNVYLKHFSNANSIKELQNDIKDVYNIIDRLIKELGL